MHLLSAGRVLTFRSCVFGTIGLLQDAHINMPFQSWELRPRGNNSAQLTIIASIVEVELQIRVGWLFLELTNVFSLFHQFIPI